MPVYRQRYNSGRLTWAYKFNAPGSTREQRRQIKESGFRTKQEAIDAEAKRRVKEQHKKEGETAGLAPAPLTLAALLDQFLTEHAEMKLAAKTAERYREQAAYLSAELTAMPVTGIMPLHLAREWTRLLNSGGHSRKTRRPRPLAAKTVRNIAGVVSSAFSHAIRWGLASTNPVEHSDPPTPSMRRGIALTTVQQETMIEAANGPWCLGMFLELTGALGARRGEVLALRWSDIEDGRVTIARSLTQTRTLLDFKATKSGRLRVIGVPASTLAALDDHRRNQDLFREQFGPDYRSDLDLVIANPDGTPLRPDSVSAAVSALCRRIKLPAGASLHTLRHTHGSHLLAGGVPLPAVSARLGHSSVRVTAEVYAHAIPGQDDEAVRKWEEYRQRSLEAAAQTPRKERVQ